MSTERPLQPLSSWARYVGVPLNQAYYLYKHNLIKVIRRNHHLFIKSGTPLPKIALFKDYEVLSRKDNCVLYKLNLPKYKVATSQGNTLNQFDNKRDAMSYLRKAYNNV